MRETWILVLTLLAILEGVSALKARTLAVEVRLRAEAHAPVEVHWRWLPDCALRSPERVRGD